MPLAAFVEDEGGIIGAQLATVVIGGLASSTVLTLVVVPVVYTLANQSIPALCASRLFQAAARRSAPGRAWGLKTCHIQAAMKRSSEQLSELQELLGVAFADVALLEQSLVHDSFVSEFPGVFSESNERFEFLGDAVLDLIVAQDLVARFPDSPEGHLTQMRASLVNKDVARGDRLAGWTSATGW